MRRRQPERHERLVLRAAGYTPDALGMCRRCGRSWGAHAGRSCFPPGEPGADEISARWVAETGSGFPLKDPRRPQ